MDELQETGGQYSLSFRADVATLLASGGAVDQAERFLECRQPGRMFYGECPECQDVKVLSPTSCDLRVCPECAQRRATDLAMQLRPGIEKISRSLPRPHYQLRHVVLTCDVQLSEHIAEVKALCRQLRTAAREMFQMMFPGDQYLGGMIGLEFGPQGNKLHLHCLVACQWIQKYELSDLWNWFNGGRGSVTWVSIVDDVNDAIEEMTHYCIKPFEGDEQGADSAMRLYYIHQTLCGVRRFVTFGTFYKMDRAITDTFGLCPDCGTPLVWTAKSVYDARCGGAPLDLISVDKSPSTQDAKRPKQPPLFPMDQYRLLRNAIVL